MNDNLIKIRIHLMLFCLVLVLSNFRSGAQLYKVELDEKIQNATLIAEGEVVEQKSFWNDSRTMIFTSNTVEVYKTFKGSVSEKTIEVLTEGGSVGSNFVDVSDVLKLMKGNIGIFFCTPNSINLKSPFTKKNLFAVYSDDQGFLRYNKNQNIAYAPFSSYEKIESNLYNLIQQKTGKLFNIVNNSFNIALFTSPVLPNGSETVLGSITSFSPAKVYGGALNDPANNTLTINGSGFGATASGKCGIEFVDGSPSSGATSYFTLPYTSYYFVSWSDTKIVVKVPSRAATGTIGVISNTGTVIHALSTLNVYYSMINATFLNTNGYDSVFAEPRLMNANGIGGYTLLYSTNTAGGGKNFSAAPEKVTFQRALSTWKEQVGVNFSEGSTTTIQKVADDAQNVVMFDNTNSGIQPLGDGTLAKTISFFSGCLSGKVYASQKTGFDVVVRNPGVSIGSVAFTVGPCFPANSEYDLETVILHELGHALNLAHINDTYEGQFIPNLNPSKLMYYAILNYVDRRSLDNSAYTGALYAVKKLALNYGPCSGLFTSEMSLLSYTVIPNDECPAVFPTAPTPGGTIVNFDLVHATSNKNADPQYNAVNCSNTGTQVTNNAFYAFKTGAITNGSLTLSIAGYLTVPSSQAACTGSGVRLAVYDVNSCPTGLAFPQPVSGSCKTFSSNAVLTITNLVANHSYLLYFDGLRNTKASFSATLNGSALPITLSNFTGEYINGANLLHINMLQAVNVKKITVEKSANGINFDEMGILPYTAATLQGNHNFTDTKPFAGNNYYRLAITSNDGQVEYSNIILLKNQAKRLIFVYPNPITDLLNININASSAAGYNCLVYDVSGRLLFSKQYSVAQGTQIIQVPLSKLAPGIYTVKLTDAAGNIIARQNIVKQ